MMGVDRQPEATLDQLEVALPACLLEPAFQHISSS